ncbi:MAG: hypothetical protein JWP37_3466 [Mucilaginibacter sp.]|nr:hypothetical protein [Mucilaginibacter sp.]
MKELNEEDIQRLLEQHLKENGKQELPGSNKDIALYQLLFTALAGEPNTLKSGDMADAVIKQIQINEKKAESFRYNLIIGAVLAGGILFAYFVLNYIDPATLKSVLNLISGYKWIVVFIILCFAIIEIADKKIVKRKFAA